MVISSTKRAGRQFVGVGVGAIIFNAQGKVFLAKRGYEASNDQGLWSWPGGEVEFGETLTEAIRRELLEEFDMVIEPLYQIAAFDHLLHGGQEHWVSVAFIALHISGEPYIREQGKCSDFGWFSLDALPAPLTTLSEEHLQAYRKKLGGATFSDLSYMGFFEQRFPHMPDMTTGITLDSSNTSPRTDRQKGFRSSMGVPGQTIRLG